MNTFSYVQNNFFSSKYKLTSNDTSPKTMIMLNDMPYRKGKSVSPCFSKVFYAEATPGVVFLIILDHVSFGLEK